MGLIEALRYYKDAYANAATKTYHDICVLIKEANDSHIYEDSMVEMIKHFESFEPSPKSDPLGIPTVGYGHVVVGGEPDYPWTEDQAAHILVQELEKRYVPNTRQAWDAKADKHWHNEEFDLLPPWVRAGLVSAVYNVGTSIISNASWPNKTTDAEAANVFYKYSTGKDRASGRRIRLAGLVRRRFCEWKLMTEAEIDFQPTGWREWYNRHKM